MIPTNGRLGAGLVSIFCLALIANPLPALAATQTQYPLAIPPYQLAVADVNGDGVPDVVMGGDGAITVLLGRGDGSLNPPRYFSAGGGTARGIAVGDFNGDGKVDVVAQGGLLLGNGDGTFQAPVNPFAVANVNSAVAGDLNGDGRLDVVFSSAGKTSIFIGGGDGTFRTGATLPYGYWHARLADLNRDSRLDLVIPDVNGTYVVLGNGDGTFGAPVTQFSYHSDAVVGDLNGDGIPDVVTVGQGCVNYALGRADGTFSGGGQCGSLTAPLGLGDLDSDGHIDIFAGTNANPVWMRGIGDGTFELPRQVGIGDPSSSHEVVLADLNRDGHADVVLTNQAAASVSVLLGPLLPTLPGAASLTPTSLDFGSLPAWQNSQPQTVTLQSSGQGPLAIYSWQSTGDFLVTSTCTVGGQLAAGASCTFSVTFAPTQGRIYSDTLTIADSDPSGSQSVRLTGTGLTNPTSIAVDPVTTAAGAPANFRAVVTSNGQPPVATGQVQFHLPNGSSFTANTGADGVAQYFGYDTTGFVPGSYPSGIRADFLFASGYAQSSGYADLTVTPPAAPRIGLSPSPLNFGDVRLGSTAHAVVTVLNTGNGVYHFAGALSSGDFTIPQVNCPYPVQPGSSCAVYVDFTPSVEGARTGTLSVTGDDAGSPDASGLTGNGVVPHVAINPNPVDFGSVPVGSSGIAGALVQNTGTAALHVTGYTITGPDSAGFQVASDTCLGQTVAVGGGCNLNLTFLSSARGQHGATLTVTDDAPGSPHSATLTARSTSPIVTLSPSLLEYGNVNGGSSARRVVTVLNSGDAPYHFAGATAAGDFTAVQNTCAAAIQPGSTCAVSVDFAPTRPGLRTGTLTVTGDDSGSPDTAGLSGTGIMPLAQLTPTSFVYSAQRVGTASPSQAATLTNAGNAALAITSASLVGTNAADFRVASSTCPAALPAGASCIVKVLFAPRSYGSRAAVLSIVDNSLGGSQSVALSGTGVAPGLVASPSSVDFGSVRVGVRGTGLKLNLTNAGNATLQTASVGITGDDPRDFAISANTCPRTLAPGASCVLTLTFRPGEVGPRQAALTIATNGVPSTVSVPLFGAGARA